MSEGKMWYSNIIVLGLLNDIIGSAVIGTSSMVYLFYAMSLDRVKKIINELNILIEWLIFGCISIILLPLKYMFISIFYYHVFYINFSFIQTILITILSYPIFSYFYRKHLNFYK